MTFATRTALDIFKNRKINKSSDLFGARGMTIAHFPKNQALTTRLSLVDLIRKQLQRSFWQKDATLIRPQSYEIQVLPTDISKGGPSKRQSASFMPGNATIALMSSPSFPSRYWSASRVKKEKLVHTSSNLG